MVLLPFVAIRLLNIHYSRLGRKQFLTKYGMLVEDLRHEESFYHQAYYVTFMFQRLVMSGTLVFLVTIPALQIGIILVGNLLVSFASKFTCRCSFIW